MRTLLTLFLLCLSFGVNAQRFWREFFESPNDMFRSHFQIDTDNYHHNVWQIGRPYKKVFDTLSPYSRPNVIVTDTMNTYPPGDTSVFVLKHGYQYAPFSINFEYMLDIDSGTIVKMELSGDSGLHWIDPLKDDTTYLFYWGFHKPRFDTSIPVWQDYHLNMERWASAVAGGRDTFPFYRTSDTLLFRFTFISDTDTSVHRDGWMMDNFYVENDVMVEAGTTIQDNDALSIYPVPSAGRVYYQFTAPTAEHATIVVYDVKGQSVYRAEQVQTSGLINLPLPPGSYMLRYYAGSYIAAKKIVITQ